jgi:hypothetical protein
LIQLIPIGGGVTNPPVVNEPKWSSSAPRELAKNSCFDCHSNETTHPWYSKVAPSSWLYVRDVKQGRRALNFSDWPTDSRYQKALANEIREILLEGEMPPIQYTIFHPDSKLSSAQIDQLVNGLGAVN